MKPNISEFSYGFALTSEIVKTFGLSGHGAPSFPNQVVEGKPGGGYDMKLPGLPIFVQFKLSQCLTTKNAKDSSHFGLPYYRFNIRAQKYSKQHQLLLDLEAKGKKAYYAAPRFHEPSELDDAFSGANVIAQSAFFAPSSIGALPDEKEHSVSFGMNGPPLFRSEPKEIEFSDFAAEIALLKEQLPADIVSTQTTRGLIDQLVDTYMNRSVGIERERANRLRNLDVDRSATEHASFIARNLFGSEIFYLS